MSEKGERQLGVTIFKTVYNCTIMGLKEVLEEKKLLKEKPYKPIDIELQYAFPPNLEQVLQEKS